MNRTIKQILKKAGKTMIFLCSILFSLIIFLLILLFFYSPGKIPPLKDQNGNLYPHSIAIKEEVIIGGIPQKMFIRGQDQSNPVLLFLHGGPGSPELPLAPKNFTTNSWEQYYTVCYWEQRGAGMSYSKSIDPSTMTLDQFIKDTVEITNYLQEKFSQPKIYLFGHSWGSYLGLKTVQQFPEFYTAFIGMGQVSNQAKSEEMAYYYLLEQSQKTNNTKDTNLLKNFNPTQDLDSQEYLMKARTPLLNKYHVGVTRENISMISFLKNLFFFKGYTITEKLNFTKGGSFSIPLFKDVFGENLFVSAPEFAIPIYFIQGKYDYQVSYTLALEYFNILQAPVKKFYVFENSAHSPFIEEPEKFLETMLEIRQANT